MQEILITCPHCEQIVLIMAGEINCGIFRHAVLKSTGLQVNPHETEEKCCILIQDKLVLGCCKPFRLVKKDDVYCGEICDYI